MMKRSILLIFAFIFLFVSILSSCKTDTPPLSGDDGSTISQPSPTGMDEPTVRASAGKDEPDMTDQPSVSDFYSPTDIPQPTPPLNLNQFVPEFTVDNTAPIESLLTKTYTLQELEDFFGTLPPMEKAMYGSNVDMPDLSVFSVDEKFPIECLRQIYVNPYVTTPYTVYMVSEGGFFYVFWNIGFENAVGFDQQPNSATAIFTAHITSLKSISDFDSIRENVSTAEDVASIDPALQLSFAMSSRLPSYSLLEDGSVLEICYEHNGGITSRKDLVVVSKEVISNEISVSHLAFVLAEDLP